MVAQIPGWFIWTTTIGIALVLVLLWLIYGALYAANTSAYAMMQRNGDISMANSGMMRMMARSMMNNNMMEGDEFEKFNRTYDSISHMNEEMGEMMEDRSVDESEMADTMREHRDSREMMDAMMR